MVLAIEFPNSQAFPIKVPRLNNRDSATTAFLRKIPLFHIALLTKTKTKIIWILGGKVLTTSTYIPKRS